MNDVPDLAPWSARMKTSLNRLASPPAEQITYLRELGVGPLADELALEFDDAFRPLAALFEDLGTANQLLARLYRLDSALQDPELEWTFDAVSESPMWKKIRNLALSALEAEWPAPTT